MYPVPSLIIVGKDVDVVIIISIYLYPEQEIDPYIDRIHSGQKASELLQQCCLD